MTLGLKDLVVADITEKEDGTLEYGTPEKLAEIISADLSVTVAEGTLYADDAVSESVKEFVKGAISLGVKDVPAKKQARLLGMEVDADGVAYGADKDEPPYVAIGFRAKKTGGQYRYVWLYKVKFKIPNESYATKGESITFNTPTIEGEFFTRHDGKWKADYVGKETEETAQNFLKTVREPKEGTPAA